LRYDNLRIVNAQAAPKLKEGEHTGKEYQKTALPNTQLSMLKQPVQPNSANGKEKQKDRGRKDPNHDHTMIIDQ